MVTVDGASGNQRAVLSPPPQAISNNRTTDRADRVHRLRLVPPVCIEPSCRAVYGVLGVAGLSLSTCEHPELLQATTQ